MPTVRDIMKRITATVSPSATIKEVAQKMKDSDVGVVPVCENGKLRGVITRENMINRVIAGTNKNKYRSAASLMSNNIPKISAGTSIVDAARIMARRTVHYMPVVQNGKLLGILTIEDILRESPTLAVMVMTRHEYLKSRERATFVETA